MKTDLKNIRCMYFAGIGGIGMSALARYFKAAGVYVAGYDRVRSPLCEKLEAEGMEIAYDDAPRFIPERFTDASTKESLVVYTPALPERHAGLNYLRQTGREVIKRSELLGRITREKRTAAIAGTHGKTSVSALTAHLLNAGDVPANAFLGGIAGNFDSNVVIRPESPIAVAEADEYDRSFLRLSPEVAVVTSVGADHLDVYGDAEQLIDAFNAFAERVPATGAVFCKYGLPVKAAARIVTYGIDCPADITASGIEVRDGRFSFEVTAYGRSLGRTAWDFAGRHNIENALAATGIALWFGVKSERISELIRSFRGVKRRFETHVKRPDCVYIDDYAHHPEEIEACIGSARELYPEKRITGVFQPHLYSRTRDFGDEFARSLEALNELLLMEIYPAREEPIPGIDGSWLLNKVALVNKKLCDRENVVDEVLSLAPEVLLTMGAGDIDRLVKPIKDALDEK